MKNIILILAIIVYMSGCSASAHVIDVNEENSISSTADTQVMNNCSKIAQDSWKKEINKNLLKLKLLMDNKSYKLLIKSQKEWQNYKDKENILIKTIASRNCGTMYLNVEQGLKTDILRQRALKLQEYIELFDD